MGQFSKCPEFLRKYRPLRVRVHSTDDWQNWKNDESEGTKKSFLPFRFFFYEKEIELPSELDSYFTFLMSFLRAFVLGAEKRLTYFFKAKNLGGRSTM